MTRRRYSFTKSASTIWQHVIWLCNAKVNKGTTLVDLLWKCLLSSRRQSQKSCVRKLHYSKSSTSRGEEGCMEVRTMGADSPPHGCVARDALHISVTQCYFWNRICGGVLVKWLPPLHYQPGTFSSLQGYGVVPRLDREWVTLSAAFSHWI